MPDDFAAKYPLRISREQGRNAFGQALRAMVGGRHRVSVERLAKDSGVKEWQIRAAMIDGGSPDNRPLPPEALLSIMLCLGADFTNQWIGLAKQEANDLPEFDPGAGDYDDAAIEASELAHEVQRARHPASPGGIAIVPQEAAIIMLKARKSASSARKVA